MDNELKTLDAAERFSLTNVSSCANFVLKLPDSLQGLPLASAL